MDQLDNMDVNAHISFPVVRGQIVILCAESILHVHHKTGYRYRYSLQKRSQSAAFVFKLFFTKPTQSDMTQEPVHLCWAVLNLMPHTLCVTHQPMLNSTWASNRATTGAVAALHPLTLDRIRPSCLACRTILMKPGRWLLVSDTKSCSFSFSSSAEYTHTHTGISHEYLKSVWRSRLRLVSKLVNKLQPTRCCHVLLHWAVFYWAKNTHASLLWSLDQRGSSLSQRCRPPWSLPVITGYCNIEDSARNAFQNTRGGDGLNLSSLMFGFTVYLLLITWDIHRLMKYPAGQKSEGQCAYVPIFSKIQ